MESIGGWFYSLCVGAMLCVVVSALLPSERYRKAMNAVLGIFMLCCFLLPTGISFSGLAFDSDAAEEARSRMAQETGDYFLARGIALSKDELADTAAALLAEYGINRQAFEIYIDTDESGGEKEVVASIVLPLSARERHAEIAKVLEYELGVIVRLEYREDAT